MDKIIAEVKETLEKEHDVIALFLFGSRAAGKEKKGSDYDFFVILDRNTKDTLREDEISRIIINKTKKLNAIVHLTFQYLYIVNEDKSLLLKISSEARLVFSKGMLFGSFKQFNLRKYYLCEWNVDMRRISSPGIVAVASLRQQIRRMLFGYKQKYNYKGARVHLKQGIVDDIGIIAEGDMLMIIDTMLGHLNYLFEKHFCSLKILHEVYLPADKMEGIWKYRLKKSLESYLAANNVFVRSIEKSGELPSDSLFIKFVRDGKAANTIRKAQELPDNIKEYLPYFKNKLQFVP
ncbi:MAG: nucleotidyltransferase domain-containing protein [Nanoarchaeota archaeon]|nr:nucleotidyltransferase domain-containing protein [Nanoarchaeota archaeon]